jgi:nitric oxide reductase activation protein
MISSLSYENEKVFYTTVITTHKNIHCHITIDASSSMSGDKFNNCIISAVAIAQAASMTKNISVTIDFRFTMNADKTTIPVILIAYDSKKDKMHKITTLFRYLKAYGTTPEGLCFESISKIILNNNKNDKNFFINFSDGMPYFGNEFIRYQNDIAIEHTRKQVEKIKFAGIEVISYFIADEVSDSILNGFKKMYGDDATNINVTSIIPLTKSLNEKFLKI